MKEYILKYKNYEIGKIIQTDEDFPNLFGKFELTKNELPKEIMDYIYYSIKFSKLLEEDEKKWEEYMKKNEKKYIQIINSKEWYLVDNSGKNENILVPIIGDNSITWRWDY